MCNWYDFAIWNIDNLAIVAITLGMYKTLTYLSNYWALSNALHILSSSVNRWVLLVSWANSLVFRLPINLLIHVHYGRVLTSVLKGVILSKLVLSLHVCLVRILIMDGTCLRLCSWRLYVWSCCHVKFYVSPCFLNWFVECTPNAITYL